MMTFGPAGGGKSTFLLGFATELCRHGKVLFAAAEEGHSNSLIEKLNRLEVFSDRILISSAINVEELNADLDKDSAIRFLIVDSIAALPITVAQLSDIAEARRLGVAFSLHATKGGSYRGATSWAHWVDVVAKVEDGTISLEKNRFGPLCTGKLTWACREQESVQL
jgi:predicted ATP-dependent serine protease